MRHSRSGCWGVSLALLALLCTSPGAASAPPDRAAQAAGLHREASRLLEAGEPARAAELFEQAARLDPGNPQLQFDLGLARFRAGDWRAALDPLAAAAAVPKLAANVRYLRGAALFQLAEYAGAVSELAGLEADPARAGHVLYMRAEAARRLGRTDEAQQASRELLARFPGAALTHKLMGIAYDSRNQLEKALAEFEAGHQADPALPELAFAAGFIAWKRQDFPAAEAWFRKELALAPCYAHARHYLADSFQRTGQTAAALASWEQALGCDPGNVAAWIGKGAALAALDRPGEAQEALERALALDPDQVTAHYRLGQLLRRQGLMEQAARHFARVKELHAAERREAAETMQPGGMGATPEAPPLSSILR